MREEEIKRHFFLYFITSSFLLGPLAQLGQSSRLITDRSLVQIQDGPSIMKGGPL